MIYIASYAPFDISVRFTRTMIYIASYAPFYISVGYTRTMIYIASYAPFDILVRTEISNGAYEAIYIIVLVYLTEI
jgi:hypothetical protein